MSKVCEIARTAIMPTLNSMNVEIVDMEFNSGRKGELPTLWIYVSHENGVDLNLLETVHHAIDPILDEADPTCGSPYTLNVSSPGLDRPFKTQADFDRNCGSEVEVKLYTILEGKKELVGILLEANEEFVSVEIAGERKDIERKNIAKISKAIKF